MDEDLFDALDRFQQNTQNRAAPYSRHEFDAEASRDLLDHRSQSFLRDTDVSLELDAFDKNLLASPERYQIRRRHNHLKGSTDSNLATRSRYSALRPNVTHEPQEIQSHFISWPPTQLIDPIEDARDQRLSISGNEDECLRRSTFANTKQSRNSVLRLDQRSEGLDDANFTDSINAKRSPCLIHSTKSNTFTPIVQGISLISTNDLPDRFRSVFPFPLLNAVQSRTFKTVYETNDNLVLSAPTGSGKTGVLELAVCHLMATSAADSFKVVYQAPTKSLCSERQRDWQAKFRPLGLKCAELTGDTSINQLREVQHASIIITTPEKWDSITRKWKDRHRLMEMIKLFLVDEVHILKEERGATLEAVVSRMKSIGSDVRFIAVSATIPNSQDVATWLGKDAENSGTPARLEVFGEEFRPVRLQKHVCGFQGGPNDFGFDKFLSGKLPDVITKWSQRKPLMIFCPTRKSCVETAKLLSGWWVSRGIRNNLWEAPRLRITVGDKDLQGMMNSGVAFHHAGVSPQDRAAIEKGYLEGNVNIICCTSTLAIGVNLPCHMVIIKGTVTYQGQATGACREYSDLEIMQMLGRAGRPQFDTTAIAVIMTRSQRVMNYEKMITGQEVLESSLHQNLIEHINAEIGLGTVTNSMSAKKWLKGTFLYIRLQRNPNYYRMQDHCHDRSVDEQLEDFCTTAIAQLEENRLVICKPNPTCTEFGDAMARYCVRFDTMKTFLDLPAKPKVSEILHKLAEAVEFKEVRIRPGDKTVYREINKNQSIKFPVSNSLDSSALKVSLIIQSVLGAVELPGEDPKIKVDFQTCKATVFNHITRLIRCIIDCQLHIGDSIGTRNSLLLARSFGAQVWDDSPLHMKQLDGIGLVGIRRLVGANITSIEDLHAADPHQIERALSRNPPLGKLLHERASLFPRLRIGLAMELKPTLTRGQGVAVQVKVNIGFLNPAPPFSFQRKAVYVCLLVDTSAGNVIHFGRISAKKLGNNLEISLNVNLTSNDQTVRGIVMCDEIAGTARHAVLKPGISANWFTSAVVNQRSERPAKISNEPNTSKRRASASSRENSLNDEFDESQLADEDLIPFDCSDFKNIDDVDIDVLDMTNDGHRPSTPRSGPQQISRDAQWEPRQLDNGKWACNHACTNKRTCKHRCCQEGLNKKPKPPKAKDKRAKDPSLSPTQQRLDEPLIRKPLGDKSANNRDKTSVALSKLTSHGTSTQTNSKKNLPPGSTFYLPSSIARTELPHTSTSPGASRGFARRNDNNKENSPCSDYGLDDLDDFDFAWDNLVQKSNDSTDHDHNIGPDVAHMSRNNGADEAVKDDRNDARSSPLFLSTVTSEVDPDDEHEFDPRPDQGRLTDFNRQTDELAVSGEDEDPNIVGKILSTSKRASSSQAIDDAGIFQNKRPKLCQAAFSIGMTSEGHEKKRKSNDAGSAKGVSNISSTERKSDAELSAEEWFKIYLGTEHFNYIG